jgi:D-inositol-3-phosphate glycosyltransferase
VRERSLILPIAAPTKVAIISYHTSPLATPGTGDAGGMNIYVRETAAALGNAGIEVDIFTRHEESRDPVVTALSEGVQLIEVTAPPQQTAAFAQGVQRFAKAESLSYRSIWSHYWLSGLVAIELAREWQVPYMASFHTLQRAKQQAYSDEPESPDRVAGERNVIANAQQLIAVSEHERQSLVELYNADPRTVSVVRPGVNCRQFRPLDPTVCRQRLELEDDRRYLLFVGRTAPLKGIEVLLEAVARIPEPLCVSALIVGGTSGSSDLLRLGEKAQEFGIADRVKFVGSVPHGKLPLYYGAADLCVVSSYYESFGMVALEAQACARPVVASDTGGLPAVVQHGVSGLLVPAGSPEQLSDAILQLLETERLAHTFGEAGSQAARSQPWSKTTQGVVAAMRRCQMQHGTSTAA